MHTPYLPKHSAVRPKQPIRILKKASTGQHAVELDRFWREIVDSGPEPVVILRDLHFAYANSVALDLFGAAAGKQLLGRNCLDSFHPRFHGVIRERLQNLLPGERIPWRSAQVVRLDGRTREVEFSAAAVFGDRGTMVKMTIRDVTERKRFIERLVASEQRLTFAAQTACCGTYDLDFASGEIRWSTEALLIAGLDREDQVSLEGFAEMVHPQDRIKVLQAMRNSFDPRGAGTFEQEYRIVKKGGGIEWVLSRGRTFFVGEGLCRVPNRAIGTLFRITERIEAEAAVVEAKDQAASALQAKEDFLAILSHELRTPLNPALMLASAMEHDLSVPEAIRNDFGRIRRSIVLEARLIDDLLLFNDVAAGNLRLHFGDCDLHQVVRQSVELLAPEFLEKRLQVQCRFDATDWKLRADSARLAQVIWNVLSNSVKFTPENGEVAILTTSNGRSVRIEITDSGVGLSRGEILKIFEPFTQGECEARQRLFGGLGLGLAITKNVVELHGGKIWAESAGAGGGATFFIELPLAGATLPA